jgi:hypothetical protein
MKNFKLVWGGKNNTKVLKMMAGGTGGYGTGAGQASGTGTGQASGTGTGQASGTGGGSGQDTGGTTTETYIEPTGETQSYPINQVLVTPGNLTAWGSLTINWINSPVQQQTQEVDSAEEWFDNQSNLDFGP